MRPFVRVKMCGITRAADARIAVDAGAQALGFVFWPASPRVVTPEAAAGIARAVPALVTRVGVFVNQSAAHVEAVVRAVGLDVVQLHGDEPVAAYRAVGARLIKALALDSNEALALARACPSDVTLLVDASDRERRGGTGKRANWSLAAELAAERPVILAGGLSAENVAEAIRTVRPWGLDVSSGIEAAPGLKDPSRMRAFVAAVAAATSEAL